MAWQRSSSIPIQICLVEDESERSVRGKLFRRSSSLGKTFLDDYERAERRSSLRSLFSKAGKEDAVSTPNFQEQQQLELFKSKEFQANLKEHLITTTAGAQIMFQQFLHDRNCEEITLDLSSSERDGAAVPVHTRKKSGVSLLGIASRSVKPSSKRRGTNDSEHSPFESIENSLDESIWSIDDSRRKAYLSVIRGDIESFFQPPEEVKDKEQQVNDTREEDSGIRSFIRRSSSVMAASIDTASYHSRRGSIFSSIGSKGHASVAPPSQSSVPNASHARQSTQSCEPSCIVTEGVRSDDDISVGLEDLVKELSDDNTHVEDDRSNNGKVEVFFLSRRRSSCSSKSYDAPRRRSSLVSHTSETSSHLQKCLNEINTDNILSAHLHTLLGGDEETIESGDGDSVGTVTSFATDQALLCKRDNLQDAEVDIDMPRRPKFVELDFHHQKLSYSPRSNRMHKNKSCSNLASGSGQLQKDFIASRDSLLVEWGEAYDSEDDSV